MRSENWKWNSNVVVTVRRSGLIVRQERMHNVITRGAMTLVRDALRVIGDARFQVVGIGANGDAVSEEDTDLGDERLRVAIISRQVVSFNAVTTTAYVAPGQANDFTINEIGWWGGEVTESLGTGILMSRVLFNHSKTNIESIQVDRTDTFAEAV